MKTTNKLLFALIFLSLLSLAFMLQITVGQKELTYEVMPYIFLPLILFFFLHHKAFPSIGLCLFIGILSSAFSSLPAPALFFLFLSLFLFILFIKQIFFYKSTLLFFSLVTLFSLSLPFLSHLFQGFPKNDFFFPQKISLLKTFTTLIFSFILFPFLKKKLQTGRSF